MVCIAALVLFCGYHVAIHGDTLKFFSPDSAVIKSTRLGLTEQTLMIDGRPQRVSTVEKAYVSDRGQYALVYRLRTSDSVLESSVKFFNRRGKLLWQKSVRGEHQYNPGCGLAHDLGFAVILRSDLNNHDPALYLVSSTGTARRLNKDAWHAIVDVVASDNGRFLAVNTRRKERKFLWDCLLFIDTKTGKEWFHTFPDCLSCSRPKSVRMEVDQDGTTSVVYKQEVYIFARDGRLVTVGPL